MLNERQMQFVLQKVRVLRRMQHENVICVADFFETDLFLFVVYCRGGYYFDPDVDLLTFILGQGPFSEGDARGILRQIIKGIDHFHSYGICHRDIKLENILLSTKNFHVVISGFDLSVSLEGDSPQVTRCGTLPYMAPEVLSDTEYTPACDIWSLGVVAFAMLTGCYPFHSGNRNSREARILSGDYDTAVLERRHISIGARNFIARIFAVDASERPTAAELLRDPWLCATPEHDADVTESAGTTGELEESADSSELW